MHFTLGKRMECFKNIIGHDTILFCVSMLCFFVNCVLCRLCLKDKDSFSPFTLKKKKSLPSKRYKRFCVREIFKKRTVYGLYNKLVKELQNGDRELYFK